MDKFNADYARALGLTVETFQFDGGQTVTLTVPGTCGPLVWRGSFEWGDEDRFNRTVRTYLDSLPWPTEDDPRVATEGTYL